MKHVTRLCCLLLTMLLCIGVFTACSDEGTTDDSSAVSSDTTDSSQDSEETVEDIIGKVTLTSTSSLTIDVYESNTTVSDYTTLDTSSLTATGTSDTVTINEDAEFRHVSSGMLVVTTLDEIVVDDMIVVTTDDDGSQKIIILEDESVASE